MTEFPDSPLPMPLSVSMLFADSVQQFKNDQMIVMGTFSKVQISLHPAIPSVDTPEFLGLPFTLKSLYLRIQGDHEQDVNIDVLARVIELNNAPDGAVSKLGSIQSRIKGPNFSGEGYLALPHRVLSVKAGRTFLDSQENSCILHVEAWIDNYRYLASFARLLITWAPITEQIDVPGRDRQPDGGNEE